MQGFKPMFRVAVLIVISVGITLASIYGMLKPISNGCTMTYMYPTYVPISSPKNVSSAKYGLYLYHEGWQKIDFKEHLKKLSGNPVLFIPGNGGSYKQASSCLSFVCLYLCVYLILQKPYVNMLIQVQT